jgi:hypothetical protein
MVDVARHQVGAADVDFLLPAVAEIETRLCSRKRPTMLVTSMFSLTPGTPGRRQQMPRTSNRCARPPATRGTAQRIILGSTSAFILKIRWPFAGLGMCWISRSIRASSRSQIHRRHQQLLVVRLGRVAGQVVEQIAGVGGNLFVAVNRPISV